MNNYKSIDKFLKNNNESKRNEWENVCKKYIASFIYKSLICLIIFISFLILIKSNSSYKGVIYDKVYGNTLSFASIRAFYDEKFGSILPSSNFLPDDVMVFNEKITYKDISNYQDGALLSVDSKYLVPLIKDGVVVFIGTKEKYGDTVIIQSEDVNIWYCNINVSDIKLYDYLEKGSYIGEAKDDFIYLVFEKNGEYLDYKNYI